MALTRVGEPREKGPRAPFIRRLLAQERFQALVLATEPFCCYTHWLPTSSATMPCNAERQPDGAIIDSADCEYCKTHCPERWRAYLHIWNPSKERDEFLEMTWLAWNAAKTFLPPGASLRGWTVTAEKGKGVKTKTRVKFDPPSRGIDPSRLPAEKTPHLAFEATMKL